MNVWVLLGLVVSLAVLGLDWLRLNIKLRRAVEVLRPDGLMVPFSSTSQLTRAIAAHKREHKNLQQELQTLKQLFQVSPIGFLQVDDENQILSCNPKACELLNIDLRLPMPPRLLLELVRSYDLDELIDQTREAQKPCHSEWLFHLVDADYAKLIRQQPRPLRGYGIPMEKGCVGVFLESREEAVTLAQQRDRWISDVAHELKTPLTSIRLVAETLQPRLEPPNRDWIDRLLKETIRLSSLVQDLLDLNQLQAHPATRLNLNPIDLPRLIQSAWISLEPLAREKSVQLDYVGPARFLIQADEARLHRVLLNLLDNSIQYSPIHQHIRVQLEVPTPPFAAPPHPRQLAVHLEVIDAGPGFPDNALPHVFERFYRADPSRTRINSDRSLSSAESDQGGRYSGHRSLDAGLTRPENFSRSSNGSGLGLAIARQIVEAHQGTITASNHPETGGAWLQVSLPWQPVVDAEGELSLLKD